MFNFKSSIPEWYCLDLPCLGYDEVHRLQQDLAAARHTGAVDRDVALFLEHSAVFTLGRRGRTNNLMVSPEVLMEKGIALVHAERGGDVTYHGPGQLIVYFIVHLDRLGLGVTELVAGMEEIMIRTAGQWGVSAVRRERNRGVWAGDRKLGSVGIAVRRGVTFHGLALNVDMDLTPFDWINPCGLHGVRMTSLSNETGLAFDLDNVRTLIKHHLEEVFGIELVMTTRTEIERLVQSPGV